MNSEKYIERRKKILKILIPLFAVALIGVIIYSISTIIYRAGKYEVKVVFAPYAASVKLGDKKISNNATHYIAPGKYHVTVEYKDFITFEEDVEVNSDTKTIYGALTPVNDDGETYMNQHMVEFGRIQDIFISQEGSSGDKAYERWPILRKLPVKEPLYTIGYGMPAQDEVVITLKVSAIYRATAIDKLMSIASADDLMDLDVSVEGADSQFANDFTQNTEADPLKYLQKGYGSAMDGFELWKTKESDGYLYGIIRKKVGSYFEMYRFVLKKTDSGWELCGAPYPVLTGKNTPNVPKEILYNVNRSNF